MFAIFERLGFAFVRDAVAHYQRRAALRILASMELPSSPTSAPVWLGNLPPQFGIRATVTAAIGPHLSVLQAHNVPLRTLVCGIINKGLRRITPMPRLGDWQVLFAAMAAPGPAVLMANNPAASLVGPWFKRVTVHGMRDMVRDLNDPECKTKYVCSPNLGAVGWSCYNQNVRIAVFNVRNPEVVIQANARVRRPISTPE